MLEDYCVATNCHRLENNVAIVTGGARGLGRVISRRLAEEGARVIIADINSQGAARAVETLNREIPGHFSGFVGDLSQPGVADEMVEEAVQTHDKVDILVNNAAALIRMRLTDFSEELLQLAVDANLWTTLRCSKAVIPAMTAAGYGRIVNIGGEAWRLGTPFHTVLGGIGKGSMVGFTTTLAGETVSDGITVNCVSPGGIDSAADGDPEAPSQALNSEWTPADVLKELAQFRASPTSIGRRAHPTEIAAAVAFFASPESSFVTGQHLGVSGGIAMI
jgi:2,3-dihydroxy-2,3-dihydro-p-cumate dehydrogenase